MQGRSPGRLPRVVCLAFYKTKIKCSARRGSPSEPVVRNLQIPLPLQISDSSSVMSREYSLLPKGSYDELRHTCITSLCHITEHNHGSRISAYPQDPPHPKGGTVCEGEAPWAPCLEMHPTPETKPDGQRGKSKLAEKQALWELGVGRGRAGHRVQNSGWSCRAFCWASAWTEANPSNLPDPGQTHVPLWRPGPPVKAGAFTFSSKEGLQKL